VERGNAVYMCLAGTAISSVGKLFIGWFGPRGLASIVFGVIVFDERLPGNEILEAAVVCTVLLSVFAHGVTANPPLSAFGSRLGGSRAPPDTARV
jgi:NhaP-type Na+/H+ or K+/H+ antiporter